MSLTLNFTRCCDVLEGIASLKANRVALGFADPPFNLRRSYGVDPDFRENYLEWCRQWITAFIPKLMPGGVFVLHHIPRMILPLGGVVCEHLEFQNLIAWKTANLPIINRLLPEHFSFLVASKGKPRVFNRFGDLVEHKRCRHCGEILADWGGKKAHMRAQKRVSDVWLDIERLRHRKNKHRGHNELPVQAMRRFVLIYTQPGDLVVDLFMGSGTTGVACAELQRSCAGFDTNPEYCALANRRVVQQLQISANQNKPKL